MNKYTFYYILLQKIKYKYKLLRGFMLKKIIYKYFIYK